MFEYMQKISLLYMLIFLPIAFRGWVNIITQSHAENDGSVFFKKFLLSKILFVVFFIISSGGCLIAYYASDHYADVAVSLFIFCVPLFPISLINLVYRFYKYENQPDDNYKKDNDKNKKSDNETFDKTENKTNISEERKMIPWKKIIFAAFGIFLLVAAGLEIGYWLKSLISWSTVFDVIGITIAAIYGVAAFFAYKNKQ